MVVNVAVPKALPFVLVKAVGTTVAVQGGVPHVENVTVPVGPAPLLALWQVCTGVPPTLQVCV